MLPASTKRYAACNNRRRFDDGERVVAAIQAADGKRLKYREPVEDAGVIRPVQMTPDLDI